jgi:chemotaxis protein MotA
MFAIIGIVIVIGAIVGGYLMEHGVIAVLLQPAELVIIAGAALGTLFIANPLPVVIAIFKGLLAPLKPSRFNKKSYLELLKMVNEVFAFARKNGTAELETHIENPSKSAIFSKYPLLAKDHHALDFMCDALRMAVSGGIAPYDLDAMMELDIEIHHHELEVPVAALSSVADALPGLGIVAAVLGVVVTMGSLGGPPEEIGHKVGAALVGTFLGILLCYGFVGPLAAHIAKLNDSETKFYHVLRVGVITYVKGTPPIMCAEFARRAIPHGCRPTFKEMEAACKGGGAAGTVTAQAA